MDELTAARIDLYEIHLTTPPMESASLAAFEDLARRLGTKPLIIELPQGSHPLQPMLTFLHEGELGTALTRARDMAAQAQKEGHAVCRCKIECGIETTEIGPYLEWHGRIGIAGVDWKAMAAICREHGAHLSNNAIKGGTSRYATMREPGDLARLRERVAALDNTLKRHGWHLDKQRWERVVFDSNLPLDAGWMEA